MNIDSLSVASQFEIARLKLYLKQNPEDSYRLAIAHFEDFLILVQEYQKLQLAYNLLESEYSESILSSFLSRDEKAVENKMNR